MSTWKETYVTLAIALDATLSDTPEGVAHIKEARLAMINLTTIGDGSELGYGTEASVRLLMKVDLLYRTAKRHYAYSAEVNKVARAINDFTILFFGDLDGFVNGLSWPDLCVPPFWAEITENGNIDTSNWTLCS